VALAELTLNVTIQEGQEARAAKGLRALMTDVHWRIFASLSAEVVALHESQAMGETTVLVVPTADLAGTGLAGLARQAEAAKR
jgi:hypothetical protein